MAGFSKKEEAFREYALNGPALKVVLSTCVPLALYQFLQSIFRILDAIMASYIGSEAVSAVAALGQITLMVTALGGGLAVGGSIMISEAYGRGDDDSVTRRVATVYALALAVSALVVVTLIPFAVPFLRLLQTPQELIDAGVGYFRIEILTLVIQFFNTVYIAIARSRGQAKMILKLNLMVIVVKLGLSALFVYGLGGGLVSIAIATLVSQVLMLLFALWSMAHDSGAFQFRMDRITMRRDVIGPIFNVSYPVTAEKLLFNAGKVMVNAMSGLYGGVTVGALGISNNIGGLTTSWHLGFTDGGAPLISQNRGAGKYRRTLELYFWLVVVNVAIGVIGIVTISQCLPWLARIFAQSRDNFDEAFCALIVDVHSYEMLGYVTLGVHSATVALLLGYGYSKLTLILNAARVFVFRIPVLWYLQNFTNAGAEAVGITMMVSNICTGVAAVLLALPVIRKIRRLDRESQNAYNEP